MIVVRWEEGKKKERKKKGKQITGKKEKGTTITTTKAPMPHGQESFDLFFDLTSRERTQSITVYHGNGGKIT